MEWRLFPLDVLFFRGTEPMNAGEYGFVRGLFPPTPEVIQGMVRTAILHAMAVPFGDYINAVRGDPGATAPAQEARALIGTPDGDLGRLDLRGPYLIRSVPNDKGAVRIARWFPAPHDLMRDRNSDWSARVPTGNVACDVEQAPIPLLPAPDKQKEEQIAEGLWISARGLQRYLKGEPVPQTEIIAPEDLWAEEPRVGIARGRETRTAEEQMLYALSFIRLQGERDGRGPVGIGVRVDGIDDPEIERRCAGIRRLGGEGRMVDVQVHDASPSIQGPGPKEMKDTAKLVLLTPARWGGGWLPAGRQRTGEGWRITLTRRDPSTRQETHRQVTVVSGAIGKPLRIGGWNLVRGVSKAAEACVPAGSVYFVQMDRADARILHDQKLGGQPQAGYGHTLVGVW